MKHNAIILIGFKHVGKSVIGAELATRLTLPFVDLDNAIESAFENTHQQIYSCRHIMEKYGQPYFRQLEKQTLAHIIQSVPSVISLGGGTPMLQDNQTLIRPHVCIHITAPRKVVFERIMQRGKPTFFPADMPPLQAFNRLWDERETVYNELADFAINNNDSITSGVNQIIQYLKMQQFKSN